MRYRWIGSHPDFTRGVVYTFRRSAKSSRMIETLNDKGCRSLWLDFKLNPSEFWKAVDGELIAERRHVNSGNYGNLTVYRDDEGGLRVEMTKSVHTPEELREMAHILNQIAEVEEENV